MPVAPQKEPQRSALKTLGERESGTARLEKAVAAFRGALEERTRERVPLDWAATQNNLGPALRTLTALLERIAQDKSLDEDTRALAEDKTKAVAEGLPNHDFASKQRATEYAG